MFVTFVCFGISLYGISNEFFINSSVFGNIVISFISFNVLWVFISNVLIVSTVSDQNSILIGSDSPIGKTSNT